MILNFSTLQGATFFNLFQILLCKNSNPDNLLCTHAPPGLFFSNITPCYFCLESGLFFSFFHAPNLAHYSYYNNVYTHTPGIGRNSRLSRVNPI